MAAPQRHRPAPQAPDPHGPTPKSPDSTGPAPTGPAPAIPTPDGFGSQAHEQLEEGTTAVVDFDKVAQIGRDGHRVVPVVLQDADSGEVLFVGYADATALRLTLERRSAVLYSTSRHEIWHKGATSGDTLSLVEVRVNCEQNSLLYRVRPDAAGACHTRDADGATRASCYYRALDSPDSLRHLDT